MLFSASMSVLPRNCPQDGVASGKRAVWPSEAVLPLVQLVMCQPLRVPKTETLCRKRQPRTGPVSG